MIAATVVTSLFVLVVTITWLSSRADASQTRCDQLIHHIRHELEIPPTTVASKAAVRREFDPHS